MSAMEDYEQAKQQEYERRLHEQQLQTPAREDEQSASAEILRYIADIDDLPIGKDDPVMGQLISRLTSTANLTPEQVKSNQWVFEYLLVLYLCKYPTPEGCHSSDRAWAHDDVDAYREPMKPERRMEIETHITMSGMALTRSEDMAATKEATRTVNESIVNDEGGSSGGSSGGIRGRLPGL